MTRTGHASVASRHTPATPTTAARVGGHLCTETDVNIRAVHRHPRAGVGLVVQFYAWIPICAAVGGAEVKNSRSVTVGIGLAAEDVNSGAAGDNDGATNFLSGLGDANGAGPSRTVVGGFAKVERLTDSAHVAGSGEQIDGVAARKKTAVLHRVID